MITDLFYEEHYIGLSYDEPNKNIFFCVNFSKIRYNKTNSFEIKGEYI